MAIFDFQYCSSEKNLYRLDFINEICKHRMQVLKLEIVKKETLEN